MLSLACELKKKLKTEKEAAITVFQTDGKPEKLLRTLRQNVDVILTQAWQALNLPADMALVGVGGYGRGELFPHSDVDVLILIPSTPDTDTALQTQLEQLVQLFWDLGLEIGHSIRTIDECLSESAADITIQTCLLEARLITGNSELFQTLQTRYMATVDAQAFFQKKMLEMHQRHAKYEDTAYSLEPNCKESPGGLRDLQVILWVAKAAGLGNSWRELAQRGLITLAEARQLMEKERAFKDIRVRLHIHSGRREDRLVFDVQTPIAEMLGFKTTGSQSNIRRASEYLMQRYYWAAKVVTQLNIILLQNIQTQLFPQTEHPQSINQRFNEINGYIDIKEDNVFEATPSSMVEVFLLMAQHAELKGMTARTLRALWHARLKIDVDFRRDLNNRSLFLQIIQAPQGITHALRRMNQTGILGRYLPNFRRIIGQMQHDLFHAYTVDQHILMVVRNVRRFTLTEHAHEYPFCSQLIANFARPWVLYIAALFHDIAKGRGGDHSKLGMVDAKQFCDEHGVAKEDTDLIVFLVEHHLTLSHVAQKKDLSDPAVIRDFAELISNERYLTALYLLTVADIRGTSPKVWNAWKGKLLEDLYKLTLKVLGGEASSADKELINRQQEALDIIRSSGLAEDAHQAFWAELDVAYFLRHDISDIAWQTLSFYDQVNQDCPVVKCRPLSTGEGLQITTYVKDQPDLFARICSYFEGKNFSIVEAKIHTTKNGYALDTFSITEQMFAQNYPAITSLIEHELTALLQSQQPLPTPTPGKTRLSRLSRTYPIIPTVDLRPDDRGQYYLLSISANDRNGLLYAIAKVLIKYKVNLHTAKIMTLGERVEDVFLVDGAALNNPRSQIELETDLLETIRVS